ncbi:MAG: OmpA family protein [Gammaproteobacteria bacterium]|nr:OmpA family protein [Gammaproteobacteria bacterium]
MKEFIAVILFLSVSVSGTVSADDLQRNEVYYGSKTVSKDELIDKLKPHHEQKPAAKTRSIALIGQEEPPKSQPTVISFNIKFDYNSYQISPDAKAQIHELGLALNSEELEDMKFVVEGHTDAAGGEDYNLELSRKRAQAIKDYLIHAYNIDVNRLLSTGKGEYELMDTEHPTSSINRRVSIYSISE